VIDEQEWAAAETNRLLPIAVAHLQHAYRGDADAVVALLDAEGVLGDTVRLTLFVNALTRTILELLHVAAEDEPESIESFLAAVRAAVELHAG
jgi:hypothetical protein